MDCTLQLDRGQTVAIETDPDLRKWHNDTLDV
jgi:hypothetical protein